MDDYAFIAGTGAGCASLGPLSYLAWLAFPPGAPSEVVGLAFALAVLGGAVCVGMFVYTMLTN